MVSALPPEEQLSRTQLKEALEMLLPIFDLPQARAGREAAWEHEVRVLTGLIHALEPSAEDNRLCQALPDFYGPMFGRDRATLLGMETHGLLQANTAERVHALHMKVARMVSTRCAHAHKPGLLARLHELWRRVSGTQ